MDAAGQGIDTGILAIDTDPLRAQRVDTLAGPQLRGPDLPGRDRWR